jgi:hypothetical protein
MTPPFVIHYEFRLPGAVKVEFEIRLDPRTLVNVEPPPPVMPEWARLSFHKCPNCPLQDGASVACPVALRLSDVVPRFAQMFSFDKVSARVTVPERAYVREDLPIQVALSSLLGVFMVTSGCPVLAKLRAMVRFHLPFAAELETITRAASMYLLEQYFVKERGGTPDWTLAGLVDIYRATGSVNRTFAQRIRAAAPKDANVNALIRLDTFARAMPDTIENQLDELGFLFAPE